MAYNRLHPNYDYQGHSSSVSSVMYTASNHAFDETRLGAVVYRGDAGTFHEWEFRTRLKMQGVTDDKYAESMSKVIDGLRGDAFGIAQQVGLERLWTPGDTDNDIKAGVDILIEAMKTGVFP